MLTEIILSVIAGIFAGGVPASILFFRANKAKAHAEADLVKAQVKSEETNNNIALVQEYKQLVEYLDKENTEAQAKIDSLYAQIGEQRRQCTELEVWKAQHEYRICEKRGCPDRTPPTGF
ncbi:MAG: hypothetical protein IK032_03730 [Bacteroidales bacterium]|nr:hypothetical protein [Bacteroidales bacterium]MBR5029301.1 hypothetical protein [Bacteroidales bacterium]